MDRIKRVLAGLAACAAFMSVGAVGVAYGDDGHTLPDGGYGHVVGGSEAGTNGHSTAGGDDGHSVPSGDDGYGHVVGGN